MKKRNSKILTGLMAFMLCFSEIGAFSVQAADDQLVEEYEEGSYFEDEAVSEDTMDEGSAEETFEENEGTDTDDVLAATAVADSFAGGSGTAADPYLIADYSQLLLIGEQTKEGLYYKLTADITANAKEPGENSENVWKPVDPKGCSLDGNGHTINNLCISGEVNEKLALFSDNGTVKEIKSISVNNLFLGQGNNGAALACKVTDMSDCRIKGKILFGTAHTNGFFGLAFEAFGKVDGCVYDAQLSSTNGGAYYSGIVGNGKNIENCITTKDSKICVYPADSVNVLGYVTGIVCSVRSGDTVINNINHATLDCLKDGIGIRVSGITGVVEKGSIFSGNLNTGTINGWIACGIATQVNEPVNACTNSGKITGTETAAGICETANADIDFCQNYGDILNIEGMYDDFVAASGIVKFAQADVTSCLNYGNVCSKVNTAAGIVFEASGKVNGSDEDVLIEYCGNIGSIEGFMIAGIVNNAYSAQIGMCYNAGNLKITQYENGCSLDTGGIVGSGNGITVFDCFNSGTIDAKICKRYGNLECVGGIVGILYDGFVGTCYNVGEIKSGGAFTYGIGGYDDYSVNKVNFSKCYYLDSKGLTGGVGGMEQKGNAAFNVKALSAEKMCKAESFTGFDFADFWQIGKNSKYPYPELIDNPYDGDPVASPSPSGETGNATVNGVEVSSLKEAFKMMKDSNTDYVVDINSDMVGEKNLSIPKTAKSVTINGNNHVIEIIGTKLSSKTDLILTDVTLRTKNKKGAPAKLNLSSSKGMTINGNVKFEASKTSVKSGTEIIMNGWLSADSLNCKELVLKPGSTLKVEAGSKVSVKNKLTGDGGSIELGEGFNKPIELGGIVEGTIKFTGAVQADGIQILKCSAKKISADVLKKSFDVKGITSNTIATYLYYSGNGKAGIFGEAIEINGSKYGLWKDAVAAMNIDKKGGTNVFSVSLLGDVNLNGKFLLPKKGYESITIAGNGHKMTFTSDINLTGNTVISGVTLIKVNKKGVQVSGKVKKGKFSYEGPETF